MDTKTAHYLINAVIVTDDASYISTQLWNASLKDAVDWVNRVDAEPQTAFRGGSRLVRAFFSYRDHSELMAGTLVLVELAIPGALADAKISTRK